MPLRLLEGLAEGLKTYLERQHFLSVLQLQGWDLRRFVLLLLPRGCLRHPEFNPKASPYAS